MNYRQVSLLLVSASLLAPAARAQIWETCNLRDSFPGEAVGDLYGWVGLNAGDVDGDGVNDLIVGAPGNDGGGSNAGRAYVYSGATALLLFSVDGSQGQRLGTDVAGAGDVNGDGFADVVVGAPAGSGPGDVFVFLGPAGTQHLHLVGGMSGDQFGAAVDSAFDVNGDGFDDLIVGAPGDDTFAANAGRVYVYSGLDGALLHVHDGESAGARAGTAVGPIGDADHDGFDDYIYAGNGAGPNGTGRAYVHRGIDGSQRCVLDTDATGVNYGTFFAGWVGDVNADGTPDFFVSDWGNSANGAGTGRVFVYSGVDCSVLLTLTGDAAQSGFGIGRGWAGDYDRDGHDDLFFGSWTADDGAPSAGKGTLFSGADGSVLGVWTGDVGGANLGFDAAGMGDVDGDGWPDFVLTAASLASSTGATYVVTGGRDLPLSYCEAPTNSTGLPAKLEYRRTVSVSANELRLRVSQAVPGKQAIFFYGPKRQLMPLGDGNLCVGGGLYRIGAPVKLTSAGAKIIHLDLTTGAPAAGPGAITAGTSWNFQTWFRDPAGPQGSNLTNALRVTFCD